MNKIFAPVVLGTLLLTSFWSCRNAESVSDAPQVDYNRTSNEVAIAMRVEPDGLNPIIVTTAYSRQVYEMMFQYLLDIQPQKLVLRPQLAKGQAKTEDITEGPFKGGVAYTFEIWDEAVWDDGRPVTGHDFAFTIKACLHPKVQAPRVRPFVAIIKEVKVDEENPKRFTVFTTEKDILGEESIAWSVPVLPEHIYDPKGALKGIPFGDFANAEKIERLVNADRDLQDFAEAFNGVKYSREVGSISGSGPYELVSWDAGQQIVLRRKDNWWGDRIKPALAAFPDTLTYVMISSDESALAAVRAEEIDILSDISPENFEDLRNTQYTAERYQFLTPASLAHYFLYLNTNKPQLADKRVRRALAHLVDVDDILETYLGYGQRLASPVLPESNYYNKALTPIDFDVEKAKQLMAEAGWEDSDGNGILDKRVKGERLEMKIPYLYNAKSDRQQSIGLLIKESAIKAGVEIELVPEEYNILNEKTKTGDYFMALNGKSFSPTLWNPKQLWHTDATGGGDNRTGFGNAETDALIDRILVTLDEEQRNQMYLQLQQIIYDEQPVIFLFVPTGRLVVHKRFDLETTPILPGFVASDLKLNL